MIISVVGNILSGKSTLAKKISDMYGFSYVPSKRNELFFLDDFFENIPEFFFPTQTSFLVSKILEIEEETKQNNNIIIDRSVLEDVDVFAQLWMDNYNISDRDKMLYKKLSNYMVQTIPSTDVYIFCKCKRSTLIERFNNRLRRSFENKYPANYIEQLCERYDKLELPEGALVIEVDCDEMDVRKDETIIEIMRLLQGHMDKSGSGYQLSMFDDIDQLNDDSSSSLDIHPHIKIYNTSNESRIFRHSFELKHKTIYLAAPFTEFALEELNPSNELSIKVKNTREYLALPKEYQNFLINIKKHLSSNGKYKVILPHKDENNWGKTYITNEQIVSSMIDNMKRSDMIVAIVSNSIGVHMEIAMMAILEKPMVLIILGNLSSGFYAKGFTNRSNTLIINVQSLDDVRKLIKKDDISNFIKKELDGN